MAEQEAGEVIAAQSLQPSRRYVAAKISDRHRPFAKQLVEHDAQLRNRLSDESRAFELPDCMFESSETKLDEVDAGQHLASALALVLFQVPPGERQARDV